MTHPIWFLTKIKGKQKWAGGLPEPRWEFIFQSVWYSVSSRNSMGSDQSFLDSLLTNFLMITLVPACSHQPYLPSPPIKGWGFITEKVTLWPLQIHFFFFWYISVFICSVSIYAPVSQVSQRVLLSCKLQLSTPARCLTCVSLVKLGGRLRAGLISAKNSWAWQEIKLRTSWSEGYNCHFKNEVFSTCITESSKLFLSCISLEVVWTHSSRNPIPTKASFILGEEVPSLVIQDL